MPLWRYQAIDRGGRSVDGELDAADEAAVVARLHRDGALPLVVIRAKSGLLGRAGAAAGKAEALTRQEVTNLTRELATMLGAGQDLDRALRFVVEMAPNRKAARVLTSIRDEVRDGASLSAALTRHPGGFSRLYVGLVRAGEAGGTLAPTLEGLADLMERERGLRATVQSALIYPVMLLIAATGAVVLLLTQVLPQFVPLFEQGGAALPASTQFLIDAGKALSEHGLTALGIAAALTAAMFLALRRPGPRLAFDRLKLTLPVTGSLAREILAARLSRTLGTLLDNGVSLVAALATTRDVLGNEAGVEALDLATESAKSGAGLATPLSRSGLFPVRLIHLLRLGEETGLLGPMALRAAAIHEERVRIASQRMVSLLTPTITIVMGAVIAGIVASLLLAMLSLNDLAAQ
jgi:general secretion pathway protein F